jgi:fatty acid-binding protein DegV
VGKLAGVKPVLTVADGTIAPVGRARGEQGMLERLIELAEPELEGGSGGTLGVVHARRPDVVDRVRRAFFERFGFDSMIVFEAGGIVGAHAGPGTWGVSYLRRGPAPVSHAT